MKKSLLIFLGLVVTLFSSNRALAHRDDYINETFVYQTLSKGEFEPEYTLDFHHARKDRKDFFLNSLGFEYGITHAWMVDGIASLKTDTGGDNVFQRSRVETRYRFSEEGVGPIDIATSLEYEWENEEGGDQALIPRLVLSKDIIPKLNTTLNLFSEIGLSEAKIRAGYALAFRYPAQSFLRYGVELQGKHPSPNELLIVPQIWLAFRHEITWKFGAGAFLVSSRERFLARTVFEAEF